MEFDDLFQYVGDQGLYQICIFMLMVSPMLLAGTYQTPFRIADMDHWCKIPSLASLPSEQQKYVAIPLDDNGDYDGCVMYGLNFSYYSQDELENWNRTAMYGDNTSVQTVPCTAWEYDRSQFKETTVSSFDLVCSRDYLNFLPLSVSSIARITGGLVMGYMSDRFGRKKILYVLITMTYGVMPFIIALARQYWLYFLAVFVLEFFNGGNIVPFVIVMEVTGPTVRGHFGMGYWIVYSLGIAVSCIHAYFIRSYRYLEMVNLLALLLWAFIWFIPDPPRWLIQNNRMTEANSALERMARMNNKTLPSDLDENLIAIREEEVKARPPAAIQGKHFADLFKSRELALRMIILCFNQFAHMLIYYTFALHIGNLAGSIYINGAVMGLIEIPAILLGSFLINREVLGRRYTIFGALGLGGLSCLIIAIMLVYELDMGVRLMSFLGKGLVALSFAGLDVSILEVIPTEVRHIGFSITAVFGGLAGMAAPYMGSSMTNIWLPLPSIINGVIGITASFAFLYIPETVGKDTCQTLEKAEIMDRGRARTKVDGEATNAICTTYPNSPAGTKELGYDSEGSGVPTKHYNVELTQF